MLKVLLKADVIISTILFFTAVYLFIDIKAMDAGSAYGQLGPAYWPNFLLFWIMILSIGVAFFSIKGVLQGVIPAFKGLQFTAANVRFIAAFSLIAGYLIFLPYIGFLVLTPFMMMAFMYLLGERKKIWIFCLPFALTASIVLIFTKAMYVPLPRGAWFFLKISQLVY
jgi:putative tricarboxylic transport membrane protein